MKAHSSALWNSMAAGASHPFRGLAPAGERGTLSLWPTPRTFAFLKKKRGGPCLPNSFIAFRRRCSLCYQPRVYISCWYKMGGKKNLPYPKNSLPLKRKKKKFLLLISKKSYPFSNWFIDSGLKAPRLFQAPMPIFVSLVWIAKCLSVFPRQRWDPEEYVFWIYLHLRCRCRE